MILMRDYLTNTDPSRTAAVESKIQDAYRNEQRALERVKPPLSAAPRGRLPALAQRAPTGLAVGSAAPVTTRDFVVARVIAYLPGRTSYAPVLLCAAPAEAAESASATTC